MAKKDQKTDGVRSRKPDLAAPVTHEKPVEPAPDYASPYGKAGVAPYRAEGAQVYDKNGASVCICAAAGPSLARRAEIARTIARALNAHKA